MFSKKGSKTKAAAFLIAVIGISVYLPALQNDFVNWDDAGYVYENTAIRSIDSVFFRWMFTTFHASNWHPITWLSHAIDYRLWGLNPLGHHLTSIILHGLNAFFVVLVIAQLVSIAGKDTAVESGNSQFVIRNSLLAPVVTGLLFAVHPLHVESVAWVSERKDLLCAFFILLSIYYYLRYAQNTGSGSRVTRYILSLFFFMLALMSKPMAVSLPVVLIILDAYPLERFKGWAVSRKLLMEKAPFFMLSAALSVVTVIAQKTDGAVRTLEWYPMADRLMVSVKAPLFYLYKMLWPAGLSPIYPYPRDISFISFQYMGAFILMLCITVFCIKTMKRQRVFLAVWMYYLVMLLPVLGIVQVGEQSAADRYTYLPSLGPFLLAGIGVTTVYGNAVSGAKHLNGRKVLVIVFLIIITGVLSVLTVKQTGRWKDSLTFWNAQINNYPDYYRAYSKRGQVYENMGDYERAVTDYTESIRLFPFYAKTFLERGNVYGALGQYKKAIKDFDMAIMISSDYVAAYTNRGIAYLMTGDYKRALSDLNKAIELDPGEQLAYYNRNLAYKLAITDLTGAIKKDPADYDLYIQRGASFTMIGRLDKAIEDFSKAVELQPEHSAAYYYRGQVYNMLGDRSGADKDIRTAARLGDRQAQNDLSSRGMDW